METSITIKLNPQKVEAEIEENGIKITRELSVNELFKILSQAAEEKIEEKENSTPLLYPGTVYYSEEIENPQNFTVIIYEEAGIREVVFNDRRYTVGFPPAVYKFKVINNLLIKTWIYAVKNIKAGYNTELFRFPFFNIYSNSETCLGTNRIKIFSPWEAGKVPLMIREMSYDFANQTTTQNLQGDSLLKALENKPFPLEWLVPVNKKIRDLI